MNNHYVFSETQVNADELRQLWVSRELFNAYKGYCEECVLKPYSQKNFVQQITAAFPGVVRGTDKLGKRRILSEIRHGEVLG